MSEVEKFTCPRRNEMFAHEADVHDADTWRDGKTCSYCGSLSPDEFLRRIEAGHELGPTDKNYKVYLNHPWGKFYFQHLSVEQKQKFVDLINTKKLNIGYPGHFYVLPFFIVMEPIEASP